MKEKMMQSLKYWLVLLFIISAALVVVFQNNNIVKAVSITEVNAVSITEVNFEDEYIVGDTITIPIASLQYEGDNYDTTAIIHLPDGRALRTSEITFTQEGEYKIEYRTVINESIIREYKTFKVINTLFSVTSVKSSAVYDNDNSGYDISENGIDLSLSSGDRFQFNEVIDLNSIEDNPLFKFYVTPKKQGSRDAQGIYIYLTDVYNTDNVITIKVQSVAFSGRSYVYIASYVMAAAPDQTLSGKDSESGKIHVNNRFGTCTFMSMYGNGEKPVNEEYTSLYFDYHDLIMSVGSHKGTYTVCDFDDPAYFSELWNGFTTGEVLMSVEAYGYLESSFNMFITEVAGVDLAGGSIIDNEGPEINIDFMKYNENSLPSALMGYSYPVFSATALDKYSGTTNVKTNVYYGYYADTKYEISISDGRFETNREGLYTIVYTSNDNFGNKSIKTVDILSKNSISDELKISFNGSHVENALVGQLVPITDVFYEGGFGEKILKTEVKKVNDFYTVDLGKFRPDSAGVYTVNCTVKDIVMQEKTISYTVNVSKNLLPVFIDEVVLPKYLIKNMKYDLPNVYAYDYNIEEYISATVDVIGGLLSGNILTPTADEVTIKYIAENLSGNVEMPFTVQVVNVNNDEYLDVAKYFKTNNLNTSVTINNVILSVDNNNINADFEFINSLLADDFSIKILFDSTKNNFTSLDIYLIDYINSDISVKITILKDIISSKTKLLINGEDQKVAFSAGFFNSGEINLSYNNNTYRILDGLNINKEIKNTLNGAEFFGFKSNKMYLKAELNGVENTGESVIKIESISGQLLNSEIYIDETRPRMKLNGEYSIQELINSEINVLSVSASDVLDINTIATVIITDPSGNILADVNNYELNNVSANKEYLVCLNMYGTYTIKYRAYDNGGSSLSYYYSITVIDLVPPIISNVNITQTAKVGTTINLPVATVTDNIDSDVVIRYLVVTPDGKINVLNNNNFVAELIGTYKIRYYAIDSAGNICLKEYIMVVGG